MEIADKCHAHVSDAFTTYMERRCALSVDQYACKCDRPSTFTGRPSDRILSESVGFHADTRPQTDATFKQDFLLSLSKHVKNVKKFEETEQPATKAYKGEWRQTFLTSA
jgi:hypothetical protein